MNLPGDVASLVGVITPAVIVIVEALKRHPWFSERRHLWPLLALGSGVALGAAVSTAIGHDVWRGVGIGVLAGMSAMGAYDLTMPIRGHKRQQGEQQDGAPEA